MNIESVSKPLSLNQIHITDSFWLKEMELVRKEVIPYQWEALNDRVKGAAPSFCMRNFKVAGKLAKARREKGAGYVEMRYPLDTFETLPKDPENPEDRFYGFVFQDSDFAKWIEAVGYSLSQHPDPALEAVADSAIDIVCGAQQEDGYLNTYYIINDLSRRFTNLRDHHELYCFGHLAEGAIAYYQATGKDKLLKAAGAYADYIDAYFGPAEGRCQGYPGHEIAEMALTRLYEITGQQKYLNLSKFFLDERGKRPYYFDQEHPPKDSKRDLERYQYHQAHLPVREQKEAVGHAVRGVYLYSGMADVARLTKDPVLLHACEALWDSIVDTKMYITGGIGATHVGEAFSFPYDLPNDTAYAETCASIGLVFFARRMLENRPVSKYADVMERALYNGVLSGMALDGKSFFYVNPLEVLPEACHQDERKRHVKPVRQKWFGCACCPPNIARLLSAIAAYAYTETPDTLFVHLYIGSEITKQVNGDMVKVHIQSGFPWDGQVSVKVEAAEAAEAARWTLALRIPEWCQDYTVEGAEATEGGSGGIQDGYLYITRQWTNGDTILLNFPMDIKPIEAHPSVRENTGKVALTRGPLVYCMEETDNGRNLHLITQKENLGAEEYMSGELGQEMLLFTTAGKRRVFDSTNSKGLYHDADKPVCEDMRIKWVPYFAWANRGEGEMQVWVRTEMSW